MGRAPRSTNRGPRKEEWVDFTVFVYSQSNGLIARDDVPVDVQQSFIGIRNRAESLLDRAGLLAGLARGTTRP